MELQIATAGSLKDAEKFKDELRPRGFNIIREPDGKHDIAVKTFVDSNGATRAEIRVLFLGFNDNSAYEFDVSVKYRIDTADPVSASWFSVHKSNVIDKLLLVEAMLTDISLITKGI